MIKFLDRFNNNTVYREITDTTRSNNFTAVFGVQRQEKPIVANAIEGFQLYVTSDYVEAQQLVRTLTALGGKYCYLPHQEDVLTFANATNKEDNNSILYGISQGEYNGVVVCVESLMQYHISKQYLLDNVLTITTNMELPPNKLIKHLIAIGYTRVDNLDNSGQVVARGDIVELISQGQRYRIDYWGDTIDNIVAIDSQLTKSAPVDSVVIVPTVATVPVDSSVLPKIHCYNHKITANAHTRLTEIINKIELNIGGGYYSNSWLLPFVDKSTLLEYLPSNTVVMWDEPKLIASKVNFLYSEQDTRIANLIGGGEILPCHSNTMVDRYLLYANYNGLRQIALQTLPYTSTFFNATKVIKLSTSAVTKYSGAVDKLHQDISNWLQFGYEVILMAGDMDSAEAIREQLSSVGTYMLTQECLPQGGGDGLILPLFVENGYVSHSNKLVIVGARELGRGNKKITTSGKKSTFLTATKGDYVVHDHHGIGLFEGIQRLDVNGDKKDFFVVLYKLGDRLYVPAESSDSLTRYSGGEKPNLSKLGGADFAKLKTKVKASIKEMSINLVELYASRNKPRGFSYIVDEYLEQQFAEGFAYTETVDQQRSIQEVALDMSQDKIMDRILVGDVGFGKTEVAMRAVFTAVSNGYQCGVLAPTTILSEQHYNSFVERMAPFNIRVACVNRFRTKQQQQAIIQAVKEGKIDVLVGTHRLLSQDIKFNNLSLLVLDEEQRFGVEHKEKIKAMKNSIDVLTLSATPIPRTLHMALSGIRDISTINTPPPSRQAVDTYVVEGSLVLIRDIVMRELNRGGQAFIVYNRVETIDRFATSISDVIPEANIIVAHGQMPERALEDAVVAFGQGKGNVLICSTIIENGINIPNANTLIVYDADKLGLSQLYQLRGRVGRGDKLGYAYFMYQEDKVISSNAYKRLSSITQHSELGSGFKIAMMDLEIRGAGNILGKEQHGHMVKVGYDMYAKLLAEAVSELGGKTIKKAVDTDLEIDLEAYAPDNYIVSSDERMQVYQQIAGCTDIDTIDQLRVQLLDVYGSIPPTMNNLLTIATIKVLASKCGISKVIIRRNKVELSFATREDMFNGVVVDAVVGSGNKWRFATSGYGIINNSDMLITRDRAIAECINLLQTIISG